MFVHGLTGDREKTWTSPSTSICWPRDLLASSLPPVRILTFGYDAYVFRLQSQISILRIAEHSHDLLNALAGVRNTADEKSRPIIFVAHSLGGLVCKDGIRLAKNSPEPDLHKIWESTRGIIFNGTPHAGSELAKRAKIPATLLGLVRRSDPNLLSVLDTDSEVLSHNK